ncbi:hypothetical protein OP10G_3565 [Fimbriimonas ginsengisoli Gsoil 348]|uniref:Uncharacterized protein n=1 Tax=Fimbriimonas ginsengisoli Gsoil 348 TaxID=661478 RepID=A0A068NTR3_FIMGI|nr:hypothetical protein OP10G_3565 [Fimbriimonas ginsengisoli Gsoil 348]
MRESGQRMSSREDGNNKTSCWQGASFHVSSRQVGTTIRAHSNVNRRLL